MSFKSYQILTEIKASHAAKLFDYEANYHSKIAHFLIDSLYKSWNTVIKTSKLKQSQQIVDDFSIYNKRVEPFALSKASTKILSSRFASHKISHLSCEISLAFTLSDRKKLIADLLAASIGPLQNAISSLDTLANGKIFKITNTDNEVKLQFVSGKGDTEQVKTLFMIAVEHGKSSSRTKNYDKLYFLDLIDK